MTLPDLRKRGRLFALPTLTELGTELTQLTARQRFIAIARPFVCVAAYVVFAILGWWLPAIFAVAAYTFVSYGSTSHDLVHGNLGLSRNRSRLLLSIIELLGLRSGHAYRAAHLHHHRLFPHHDDVEGAAAHSSFLGALAAGPLHQYRVWSWAAKHAPQHRNCILAEGIACATLLASAIAATYWTPIPLVYSALVVIGSWSFPLITSYLPHNPDGADKFHWTRRFRGKVSAFVFGQHFYHLEHHLYPKVPYPHWPTLAAKLDPFLDRAGVKPIYFGF